MQYRFHSLLPDNGANVLPVSVSYQDYMKSLWVIFIKSCRIMDTAVERTP